MIMLLFATDYGSSFGSGPVILDDCNFHESVRLDNFDIDRTLALVSVIETVKYINTCNTGGWKHYNYFSVALQANISYACLTRVQQMVNFLS